MRTPHSNEIEKETIQLYYSGFTYDEIHHKLDVSTGYVSDLVNRLKEKLDANEVTTLRELGVSMKKLGITATDASLGCNVLSSLKRFEIDINDLQLFLKNLYEKCKTNDFDPEMLVKYGKMLFLLQEKSDTPLDDVEAKYGHLVKEKQEIIKDISQLNNDVENAKNNAEKTLSESNLTIQQVSEYVIIRDSLATCGVDFDDVSKFTTMLKAAKSDGFDIKTILDHLQKEGDYEQRIKQNRHEIDQLEIQQNKLEKQNKESQNELTTNQPYLDIIRLFESDQISIAFLEKIHDTITGISKQHDIDKKDSMVKFHEDILNNYDEKLGLNTKLELLHTEIDSKTTKLDLLNTKIENLTLRYKEEQNIISILKSLIQKMNPSTIVTWNKIFESAKINLDDFAIQLEKIGTLHKIISTKQQEIHKQEHDQKQLETKIKLLDESKENLESKINHIEEIAEERFEKYIKILLEQFSKFHSDTLQSVQGVATQSIDKISTIESNTKNNLAEITSELEELIDNSLKSSEQIGKLKIWFPLYELVAESKFDSDTIPILIMLLERIHLIFKQDNISTLDVDHLTTQLRKMIS